MYYRRARFFFLSRLNGRVSGAGLASRIFGDEILVERKIEVLVFVKV